MIELERARLLEEAVREFELLILTAIDQVVKEGFSREAEMILAMESAWGWIAEGALR